MDTRQDNRAHIVRFRANRQQALLAGAEQRVFNEVASHKIARSLAQDMFYFDVGQIIVNAIGAEQNPIANGDGRGVEMNIWTQRATQSLGNAAAMSEVAQFQIGKFAAMHGLIDAPRVFFAHHLILHQASEQAIIGCQAAQWAFFGQEVDAAIAYMRVEHVQVVASTTDSGDCDGGSEVARARQVRAICTHLLIGVFEQLLKESGKISLRAIFELSVCVRMRVSLVPILFPMLECGLSSCL